MFHVQRFVTTPNAMKYKPKRNTCKCGKSRRPKGRYCADCHAEKQKEYRMAMKADSTGNVYITSVNAFKKRLILGAIREERGNFCKAAMRLGIHRNTVNRILREVGLTSEQVRQYLREDLAA
jgi:DNA-binding NtrC family response regulator